MIRFASALLVTIWLAGCASHAPAPVVDLGGPPAAEAKTATAVAEVKPGFYAVKKGDTLYSIALEHGQSYRDMAAWNYIEDPNRIQIGQQLRVIPPEGATAVAVAKPVLAPAAVEVRPIGAVPAGGDSLKREPKGGKQPYSPQALALLQQAENPPPVAPVKLAERPADKPAERPIDKPVALPGDNVEWIWPASGKVTAGFVEGSNKGVDLAGKTGDPVLAAGAGKVVYVGTGIRGYGKMVIIKHNPAFLSVYAHNSQILVKEEQFVGKGQKIAEVGNTDSDQSKLHFEIRHMNKPVDPLKYLPAK